MEKIIVKRYHVRMQKVLTYIDQHLDEDLSVEALSRVAAFSKHHFHRQFVALFGIGVYRYIQLCRLKRSSYSLAFRDSSVMEIAMNAGYETPEAFARTFKQNFGQAPTTFRRDPEWHHWISVYETLTHTRTLHMQTTFTSDQVNIIEFPATELAVMKHRGEPALVGETIKKFIAWRKAAGLPPHVSETFNIFYCDPDETPPEDYHMDIGATTTQATWPDAPGIVKGIIPAGRCAVMRVTGASDNLKPAATYLYKEWLPGSGEETRDFPLFAQRVSFFPDVPEHEAITDLFLPLKSFHRK